MAEEDTQVPLDWADDLDDVPLAEQIMAVKVEEDGPLWLGFLPEAGEERALSPLRWKREYLSPKHKVDLESESSKPDALPMKKRPAGKPRDSKAVKRVKVREESRKANNLMDCFKARASTASTMKETKETADESGTDIE